MWLQLFKIQYSYLHYAALQMRMWRGVARTRGSKFESPQHLIGLCSEPMVYEAGKYTENAHTRI